MSDIQDVMSGEEKLRWFIRHRKDMFTSPEGERIWMNSPSRYLGGRTPQEEIDDGNLDRAHMALFALGAGVFV